MRTAKRGTERREDALSRERIVEAAIALLDEEGESGLTFRALATRLATGAGALYWHIANKGELLIAATESVVSRSLAETPASATPHEAIRGIARKVFETIDAHPWVGTQLSRAPWESPTQQLFECLGRQVQALGVRGGAQFTSASALLSYIVGASIQNATNARLFEPSVDRVEFLEAVSARWKALDARTYPFLRKVAAQLPTHDDLAEFLAGVDLILTGIDASL
ncbi:TetR/AcrR family transcriptional regulator [Corallococcus sp. H22C18031201]|nr:TetR/AcrR family transcriptional regulator [Corallococcus sp. H22C18031201]